MLVDPQLQNDSLESEKNGEGTFHEWLEIIRTPIFFRAPNTALLTRNKAQEINQISFDSTAYPIKLGCTDPDGCKTLEGFSRGPWQTRLKVLTMEAYCLSHQFDNQLEATF